MSVEHRWTDIATGKTDVLGSKTWANVILSRALAREQTLSLRLETPMISPLRRVAAVLLEKCPETAGTPLYDSQNLAG